MGLRTLQSGEAPPLGARLGTDTPAWDEPNQGVLRDSNPDPNPNP